MFGAVLCGGVVSRVLVCGAELSGVVVCGVVVWGCGGYRCGLWVCCGHVWGLVSGGVVCGVVALGGGWLWGRIAALWWVVVHCGCRKSVHEGLGTSFMFGTSF